jgi:ArsR family transcriptional regulator
MSSGSAKLRIFECLAEIAQALGHANRLQLLEMISQGERTVDELSVRTAMSFASTSRHLQILRNARLVETRRRGKNVLYRPAGHAQVTELLRSLGSVGEHNMAEVERLIADYFTVRDSLEPVSRKDLMARIKSGEVTVLDVRPEDEFASGHIPGALNIPLAQLKRRLAELPKSREIVAYCRGPYCVLSFEAVEILRDKGRKARRLEDGFPEWFAAGLPVDRGASH